MPVKKQHLIPGLIISLGIAIIASLPKVIRMEKFGPDLIAISICYNFIFCIFCWTSHQFILRTFNAHKAGTAILAIIAVSNFMFLQDLIFDNTLLLPATTGNKRPYILLLRGLVISGLFYFISYYLNMLSEKQKNILEIAQLKQAQLTANLFSLKEQLSPHFLFNTLNTLSTLTAEKIVKDYVSELSNVYRYVLQYKNVDTATVQQELEFIDSYLYIIKTRLETAIDISINVSSKVLYKKMPPLTLQLLVENAIKHNIASVKRQLKIEILSIEDTILEIRNNIQPKTSVQHTTGIGLDNVMQRYRLLFNTEISIEKSDRFFTVKLPLV